MKISLMSRSITAALALGCLAGCATTNALSDRDLKLQLAMADSLFLEPSSDKRVLVEVRNLSGKASMDLAQEVRQQVAKRWQLVSDPESAQYVMQVSILSAGEATPDFLNGALRNGFGGAVGTAVLAGAGAHAAGASRREIEGVALIAGLVDAIGSQFVRSNAFGVVADVQISERARSAGVVKVAGVQKTPQGRFGETRQSWQERSDWKRYRTRLVAMARQTNLTWAEAEPLLSTGVAQSLGGMF